MTRTVRSALATAVIAGLALVLVPALPAHAVGSAPVEIFTLFTTMREFSCVETEGVRCQELVSAAEPIEIDVLVVDSDGVTPASGEVSIMEGATTLATATISEDGTASPIVAAGLAAGTHDLDIHYSGDDDHAATNSPDTFDVEVLPAPASGDIQRIAGVNRIATAANMSRDVYRRADYDHAVYVARADDPNDALCAGAVAAWRHDSVLLTTKDTLSPETRDELERTPKPTEVFIVGGTAAVSDHVKDQIAALGLTVTRIAGNNRYETCVAVAPTNDNYNVFFVTGLSPYDALAASAAAATNRGVILLTNGDTMPEVSQQYFDDHGDTSYAVGGPATQAAPEAAPIAGDDRYDTAAMVAAEFFEDTPFVGIATGTGWADALAGGPHIAVRGRGPLLLVSDTVPQPVADFLDSRMDSTIAAFIYGGTAAVSDQVANQIESML